MNVETKGGFAISEKVSMMILQGFCPSDFKNRIKRKIVFFKIKPRNTLRALKIEKCTNCGWWSNNNKRRILKNAFGKKFCWSCGKPYVGIKMPIDIFGRFYEKWADVPKIKTSSYWPI